MGGKLMTSSNLTKYASFKVDGIDEYIKKIEDIGNNVEAVVVSAIEKATLPVYQDLKTWAEKHKLTGATLAGVKITEVKNDSGYIYAEIGFDTNESQTAWHAVFIEYGTPKIAADPGIRTAFKSNKNKVMKIIKDALEKGGLPIE